jgi:predicted O-methyltransferase YrrM
MKASSLWPPRPAAYRAADRLIANWAQLRAEHYQRRNPDVPWMPQSAVEILDDMLKPTDRCIEWGSGRSTPWLCHRTQSVLSLEHDTDWYQRVRNRLAAQGCDVESVRLLSLQPQDRPYESPYVRAIDEFGDGELDVSFIDGEHRATCVLESIPKLSSGGLLIVDDSQGFLDHRSSCRESRHGLGPRDTKWSQVADAVKDWRLVWTGDGYSDAAIWVKP